MPTIPLGAFEPDKGPLNPDTVDYVRNLNPIANGWGPFPDLVSISQSLGADCLGAWYARKGDGTYTLLASTATALFRYNTATGLWDTISGPSAPYHVASGQYWQAVQFGSLFIVVNLNDPPQVYNVELAGTFADLGGSPPKAKFIWIAGDYVVLGYLQDGATEAPQDIQWSGINDATYWTIDRKKGSDRQTLPDGNEIMGGFGFPGGARIIQRKAKRAMVFSGDQYIFDIKVLDATRGADAPYAIVPISSNDYVVWRNDGIFRGDENEPIGAERVDNFLFNGAGGEVNISYLDTVQGAADVFNKVVMWTYVSADGPRRILGWDWELDRFFMLYVEVGLLFGTVTPGLTLEADDGFPDNIDTPGAPSLDSRIYKGGAPQMGAFIKGGVDPTLFSVAATFSGTAMAGIIFTPTLELTSGQRSFVSGARIVGNPGDQTQVIASVGVNPWNLTELTAYPEIRSTRTGIIPMRADGFFHRFEVSTAVSDGVFTHLHGIVPIGQFSGQA